MMLGYWDDVPYFQDGCWVHVVPTDFLEDNHLKEIKCVQNINFTEINSIN